MEQALKKLGFLLKEMKIPEKRANLENPANHRWLSRNIAISNKGHQNLKNVQGLIKSLLKNCG